MKVNSMYHLMNGEPILLKLSTLIIERIGTFIPSKVTQMSSDLPVNNLDGFHLRTKNTKMLLSSVSNGNKDSSPQAARTHTLLRTISSSCTITTLKE